MNEPDFKAYTAHSRSKPEDPSKALRRIVAFAEELGNNELLRDVESVADGLSWAVIELQNTRNRLIHVMRTLAIHSELH